jgi:hypothetical protein
MGEGTSKFNGFQVVIVTDSGQGVSIPIVDARELAQMLPEAVNQARQREEAMNSGRMTR